MLWISKIGFVILLFASFSASAAKYTLKKDGYVNLKDESGLFSLPEKEAVELLESGQAVPATKEEVRAYWNKKDIEEIKRKEEKRKEDILTASLVVLGLFIIFVPAIVALKRKHSYCGVIFIFCMGSPIVCLFAGPVGAIFWAVAYNKKSV